MATKRQAVRLKKSRLENLSRHQNGAYYARVRVGGKSKESPLKRQGYTLAGGLGHNDGGILAAKTRAHHVPKHPEGPAITVVVGT